ncbi:MAG: ATP-binding protein [Bacteroidota bacterium]|nr:ATP-binding protein [Bacteroidota bacterium]
MIIPKSIDELNQLIINGVEESISLEYKASDALQNTDGGKKEIAKDISAMANSAGGVIIYGIKEFNESDKKHLPEKITPINRAQFSKEQLEQIINTNISPKIDGLIIHPIKLYNTNEVAYVVEIPKSNTAHQNTKDQRYYRRYNFQAVPMLDHEIWDIMNRTKHPVIDLSFSIQKLNYKVKDNSFLGMTSWSNPELYSDKPIEPEYKSSFTLIISPINTGQNFAQYINYYIYLPKDISDKEEIRYLDTPEPGIVEFYGENTHRDFLEFNGNVNKYGPSRFDPVLPGTKGRSKEFKLDENSLFDEREINWTVYADNARPKTGSVKLNEIRIVEINSDEDK